MIRSQELRPGMAAERGALKDLFEGLPRGGVGTVYFVCGWTRGPANRFRWRTRAVLVGVRGYHTTCDGLGMWRNRPCYLYLERGGWFVGVSR